MLAVAGEDGAAGPLLSHIPFIVAADGAAVHAHLVRANPITRLLAAGERPAVLAVSGPDGYVSPDWYGPEPDQVPTWNYVAVHLRGTLRLRAEEALRPHLDALSARFEEALRPKPPWRTSKVAPDRLASMMRAIVPVELTVETVDGTWKLNRNKTDDVRLRAAAHMETEGFGQEVALLADPDALPPVAGVRPATRQSAVRAGAQDSPGWEDDESRRPFPGRPEQGRSAIGG